VYVGGYLDEADLAAVKAAGAVGDVCTTFFRLNGSYTDLAINARGSGPDLSRLAAVPRRLCVVSELGRVSGTIGALRAGVISDLVIDEPTAAAVLTASAGLRA
jgi:deoxyribonucleoside regulator